MFLVLYKVRTGSKGGTPLINLKITAFRNVNCNTFIKYIIRESDEKMLERSSSDYISVLIILPPADNSCHSDYSIPVLLIIPF